MYRLKATVPLGVILIAGFYTFGALVLLIFLLIDPAQTSSLIAVRHGLPATTGYWILPVIAGFALLIAYGLLSLSRWGYGLTLLYLLYFGSVNWFLFNSDHNLLNFGNLLWSCLVILVLILSRRRFFAGGDPGGK